MSPSLVEKFIEIGNHAYSDILVDYQINSRALLAREL